MTEDYCIVTPVGPKKTGTIKYYKRGIRRLDPPPKTVALVTDREVYSDFFENDSLYQLIGIPQADRKSKHRYENIAYNREQLRKWFDLRRNEDCLLCVDSDIEIIYSNTAKILIALMNYNNGFVVNNPYQGHTKKHGTYYPWWGAGCLLVHRRAASFGRFYSPKYIKPDGSIERDNEDLTYINTLNTLRSKLRKRGVNLLGQNHKNYQPYKGQFEYKVDYGEIPIIHHIGEINYADRDFIDLLRTDAGKNLEIDIKNIEEKKASTKQKRRKA